MSEKANIRRLKLADIAANDWNGDRKPDADMIASVKEKGVLQPIVARPINGGQTKFQVVCGSRRRLAAIAAGLEEIDAVVRDLSDEEALELTLIENIQRQSLTPLEEAAAVQVMLKSKSIAEVAKAIGRRASYVAECKAIAELSGPAKKWMVKVCPDVPRETLAIVAKIGQKDQMGFLEGWFVHRPEDLRRPKEVLRCYLHSAKPLGKDCPFDQADDTLVEGAGACGECPKRTSADKDLFGGIFGRNNTCSDPECYRKKLNAWAARKIGEAKSKHPDAVLAFIGYLSDDESRQRVASYGAVEVAEYGSCEYRRCKKSDRGAKALILVCPDADIGKVVYGRKAAQASESSETGERKKVKPQGEALRIRRRWAWVAQTVSQMVLGGYPSKKWRKAEALLDLVCLYGADGGKRQAGDSTTVDMVFEGMRARIVNAHLRYNRVSDIDPKKMATAAAGVLDIVTDDGEKACAGLLVKAVEAIPDPKSAAAKGGAK